jgi:hypothetical protein
VTHFQVPDDRKLLDPDPRNKFPPWPDTPGGYRLFVEGSSGEERIGIEVGRQIELQLTGGRDCTIDTIESMAARNFASATGRDPAAYLGAGPVSVSTPAATSDKHKFTLKANSAGATMLFATDTAYNRKAELRVVTGHFESHPGMLVDLIANVCRGSDSLRIHALQRMLNSYRTGADIRNEDNIFEQKGTCNTHDGSHMWCGQVALFRGREVFGDTAIVANDWYKAAFHEPLSGPVTARTDLKYRSTKMRSLQTAIAAALTDDPPRAVRVGVVDVPSRIAPINGKLDATLPGGHTALIVGCNTGTTEFLYIDPWGGGSKMKYGGGIPGNQFPNECRHLGIMVLKHDPARRWRPSDTTGNNIMRQSDLTQGSFNNGGGNYLEVVSAPLAI